MAGEIDAALARREWIPDVFAALWKLLNPSMIVSAGLKHQSRRAVAAFAEAIREASTAELPHEAASHLAAYVTGRDLQERVYDVMLAIDESFDPIHPWTDKAHPVGLGLQEISRFCWRQHRYDRSRGQERVLPTSRFRRDTKRLRDPTIVPAYNPSRNDSLFRNLFVHTPPAGLTQTLVFGRAPTWRFVSDLPSPLRVGICPLAEESSDVSIVPVPDSGRPQFKVVIDDTQETVLADRARDTLRTFEREEVHFAIFPELVVTSAVRKAISSTLREHSLDRSRGSVHLHLVVAGSGYSEEIDPVSAHHFNECHVFDFAGRLLFRQRKMNHYSMRSKDGEELFDIAALPPDLQLKAKAVAAGAGADGYLIEEMASGTELQVFDAPFGRLIVLICEDLYQTQPSFYACDQLHPDWLFTPVMDSGLTRGRWTARTGAQLAARTGTNVIVANSLVLERLRPYGKGDIGFGLMIDRENPSSPALMKVRRTARPPVGKTATWPPATRTPAK